MRLVLAIILLLSAPMAPGQTFGEVERTFGGNTATPSFLPVREAYKLSVDVLPDQSALRLYWQIAEGYYLYQHRFAFSLQSDGETVELALQLPAGLEKTDEFFGDVVVYYDEVDLLLAVDAVPQNARLKVTSQGCADAGLCYPPHTQYFDVDASSGTAIETAAPTAAGSNRDAGQSSVGPALWYMLLLAFIGGAILNLMPCVFPILSLKVLSFSRSTDADRHLHSWVYSAGVVLSFVLVAALLLVLQEAGRAVGWGFQLQSSGFVIALAYLFIAMGLSLSGVIDFGGSLMNSGAGLADRGGLSGSFFTGVLAVVVASPCTAPFMGTALGFAVSQTAPVALLVFAALGAGMAAPLLLFSYSGAARSLMPRPGPWMETLKQFLAFPLYATALWLLWVAGRQTGINTMSIALAGALVLALGLWLWDQRPWRRTLALGCVVAAVLLGSIRADDGRTTGVSGLSENRVAWSEHAVDATRAQGSPVFVDVTADWCITCKANEAAVLFTDELTQAFERGGIVYMVADWTNHDPEIAALLRRYERTGIPLYLMYPADPSAPPTILPQILTKQVVLEAIEAVAVKSRPIAASST